ncbi:sushi, von Willebrand factor type A, EGF and pentraxin domain-containing protein 1-like isoform X2 [Palaemon carinicauda]|uniref:sushi, von Willebrand factor type A, EGF and pentraxin domain-containing protein 1-like isoform X2 n=1 Tax=Palaemon carinicauda TaxID=392227 RepID=UPI0035B63F5E
MAQNTRCVSLNLKGSRFYLLVALALVLCLPATLSSDFKTEKPPYSDFLNYGKKKLKPGPDLENEIIKSKVEVLGEILKHHVERLRQVPEQRIELVFLVDASASVGAENFFNEIKFVKKLLADFAVSYNQTRVAVITFSSKNKVIRHIDHVTQASQENHKCTLLENELPKIRYSGGGTYTLGAMLEAQKVLALARADAAKAVFLVTDGYSNGGDPRPAATFLQNRGVKIFTFGIRNGNVKELYDMASEPKEQHSYILESFEEFEALARRALHEDLHSGVLMPQDPHACQELCVGDTYCCDAFAACTCGTHTGHYACTCRKGYYGTGLRGDCRKCPAGTYRDTQGPGDVSSCIPCPDPQMMSEPGSTDASQCYCKRSYKQVGNECVHMKCPALAPPENGYFIRNTCNNVVNAACGVRCNSGYTLQGSSIRLCGENGLWSGGNAVCVMKSCPELKTTANGTMICSKPHPTIDTECYFTCDPGYQLVGSKKRTCLPVAMWDGIPAYCKAISCPPLPKLKHGLVKPQTCATAKSKYGTRCEFACQSGYQISGPTKTTCIDPGVWSEGHKSFRCIDVTPPKIMCPRNITTKTDPHEAFASVTWDPPFVKDNSKGEISLTTVPATTKPMKLKIGNHTITYVAKDLMGNTATCQFGVTVNDEEPPQTDWCDSPPIFLSYDEQVDVYWEEPIFSDNSGVVAAVTRSMEPGQFPQGDTTVEYTASDEAGNVASCNITITVQKHACQLPVDPINGAANCTESSDAVFCSLTCGDGYAFAMRPRQDYFCAYDGIWLPDDNPMPFPECSVTSVSNTIAQAGEMAMDDDGSVCDDIFFMGQVENELEKKLEEALSEMCAADIVCEVAAVEAVCESILADIEEESNSVGFFRKRRSASSESLDFYWPSRRHDDSWNYWRRGDDISSFVTVNRKKREAYSSTTRHKRQFGFSLDHILGYGTTTQPVKRVGNSEIQEDYLGVLIDVVTRSFASDVSTTRFASFLSDQKSIGGKFSHEDFFAAFAKEFGEDKSAALRELASRKMTGMKIVPGMTGSLDHGNHTVRPGRSASEDFPLVFPSSAHADSGEASGKRKLKVRFKVEGQGPEVATQLQDAVTGILSAADKGQFDVSFGEQQLHVAAIRLKEHLEYVCEPGSITRGDLCVKCPVGTFYNVILRECQVCPQGSFQPQEGQVSCIVCPENTSTKTGNAKSDNDCKAQCLPGSFSSDGLEPCTTCDLGQYQDEYASTECATCPHNTTTWRRGSWVIEECKVPCGRGQVSETGLQPCLQCPRGFFQKDEGKTECTRCPDGVPTATPGSTSLFDCEGITGDEQAAYTDLPTLPINDCFSDPCLNAATCSPMEFGYLCHCRPGYSGQQCEEEVNECESEPCLNNGTCIDLLDNFACECPHGYEGVQCETDINECQPDPCQNGATCVDMVDAFKCICQSGYTGEICDTDIDECVSNPCASGATCEDLLNDIFCHCPPGDTGRFCETHINECDSSPCDHGLCLDEVNAFKCVCEPGYTGVTCEEDIDDCASQPCLNGGTCKDWVNGFSCTCAPGFSDKLCQTEMPTDFVLDFPSSGILNYVAIENLPSDLTSASVCFWLRSDDKDNYGTPFSYATDEFDNALAITDYNGFVLYVNGEKRITDVQGNDGSWHMVCATWKSSNGTWALYFDGKLEDSGTGLATDTIINGTGSVVLGQEQDKRAGGYSPQESFIGELTRLDIWDEYLSPEFISETFVQCNRYVGNILGWPDVQAGLKGQVMIKSSTFCRGCGIPYVPEHGSIEEIKTDSVQRIAVTCEEGFKLYRGDPERICLVNGTWSGHEPECERVSCGFPGYLINGNIEGKSYSYGDTITYVCNQGFNLKGNAQRTCQADGFWTNEPPVCEVVRCPKLLASSHGQVMTQLTDYMPTNQISFKCEVGYQMDGPETLTCGGDGEWDGQPPTCQSGSCKELPDIANGFIEGQQTPRPGDQIKAKCEPGYKLVGDPMITCKDDGTWSLPLPKCVVPQCPKPPGIFNGQVKVRASAHSKEAVYKCDPGYVVEGKKVLSCGPEGEWDGPWSTCEGMPCTSPEKPRHAVIPPKDVWRVGDSLTYDCEVGFKLVGQKILKCEFDGYDTQWEGTVPTCDEIKCPVPTKPENGILTVIYKPQSKRNTFILPEVEGEFTMRRKRSPSDTFPSIIFPGSSSDEFSDVVFPGFPGVQDKAHDPEWVPDYYDYSVGQSTGDVEEFGQSAGGYDEFGQSAGGFDEFGQSAGGFDEFGQSAGGFDEFGQSTGGFDEFGQSAGGFDEFGQSAGGFDEFGQSAGGFDGFSQSTGGFDEFGQSTGGFIEFGQSTGGFDEFGQSTGGAEYEDFSQNSGFDAGVEMIQQGDYLYGSKLEYSCRPGFKVLGESHLECTKTGHWNATEPRCYEIFCFDLDPLENGRIMYHGSGLNSRAEYICNEGYELTGGDYELVCQFDKSWLGDIPFCQTVECGDPPDLINGTVDFSTTSFGSVATYDCYFGFVIEGSTERYCSSDGNWNGEPTKCIAVTCPVPPIVEDGYIVFEGSLYVDSPIEYECKECYKLNGTRFRYCQVDGSWSLEEPDCNLIYCDEVPAGIPNGRVIGGDNSCGSLIEYECHPGYELKGRQKATCLENQRWSSRTPTCERVSCGKPPILRNGKHLETSYYFTDKITFECNLGYILQGSKVQVCEADGKWSNSPPYCAIVNCTQPNDPPNGKIVLNGLFFESSAKVVCDRGFELDGDGQIICGPDGKWNRNVPQCKQVFCPQAPNLPFSSYNSTEQEFKAFTVLAYKCNEGYVSHDEATLICSDKGIWEGENISCEPVDCGDPGTLPNGQITGTSFTLGSKVTFSCDEGFNLLGESITECLPDGSWSNYVTSCLQITCPEPQKIEFGKIIAGDPESTYGASVAYECNVGYVLAGSNKLICGSNGTWSKSYPQCKPVTCPEPFESLNSVREGDIFEYGRKISYTCNEGYTMEGDSDLMCKADGTWSDKVPICEMVSCDEIPNIPNGNWKVKSLGDLPIKTEPDPTLGALKGFGFAQQFAKLQDLLLTDTQEGMIHKYGDMIEFQCNPGYFMASDNVIMCTENGWNASLPQCHAISCAIPIQIRNGVVIGDDYSLGATITYECDEGFELVGDVSRTCQENKVWTGTEPLCRIIECPKPAILDDGQVISFGIKYRSVLSYICDTGFTLQGTATRTCQSNGEWTGEQPACVEVFCEIPSEVAHGIRDISSLKAGGTVRYSCLEGHRLEGRSVINCDSDGQWDGSPPTCIQIDCGPPPSGENIIVHGEDTIYNSKVTFACGKGFKPEGQDWATCLLSGNWSNEAPRCQLVICPEPTAPAHGKLVEGPKINEVEVSQNLRAHKSKKKGKKTKGKKLSKLTEPVTVEKVYQVDDEITWVCDEGFQMEGEGKAMCLQSGEWSVSLPKCRRVSCGPPSLPDYSIVEENGYLYGATVNYTCREGYNMRGSSTLTCGANGQWGPAPPTCEPIPCGSPHALTNHLYVRFITAEHNEPHSYGSTASYSCEEGYDLRGGEYQVCEADGRWSGAAPVCEESLCTDPPYIPYGTSIMDDTGYPYVATFSCLPGYNLTGVDRIECRKGRWQEFNTTCEPVECCKPEVPIYGKVTAHTFYFGSIANYSCIHGYMLMGNRHIECTENGTWQGDLPICQPVDCGTPEDPQNGQIEISLTELGSEVLYYCDEGYQLFGNDSRICTANATWSGDSPQCHRVDCGALTPPEKGLVMGVGTKFGEKVKFACEKGYEIEGEAQAECLATGNWSAAMPTCKPVSCGDPPSPPNTQPIISSPTENFVFKDRLRYKCQDGHFARGDLSIKCLHNGEWSKFQGQCSRISCGRPKINMDGAIILGRSFYYRDRVFYRCPSGTFANGSTMLTCKGDGSWSGSPMCVGKCSRQCLNGGICASNTKCLCPTGWTGNRCQHAQCPLKCLHGGICTGPRRCTCLPGYTGVRCQRYICENGCGDRGRCIGPNVCHCDQGFTGPNCDIDEYDYMYESRKRDPDQTDYSDWEVVLS